MAAMTWNRNRLAAVVVSMPCLSTIRSTPRSSSCAASSVYDAGYEASVAALRDAMGEKEFGAAWAEGAEMSTEEAIAYSAAAANASGPAAAGHR